MDAPAQHAGTRRSAWIVLAKLAVTAAILGVLLSRASLGDLALRLASVGVQTVLVSIGILLLVVLAIAVRWQIVLRQFGAVASFGPVVRFTLIGGFFNQVLPSGMGGDAFRIWYARSFGLSTGRALASVLVDRIFGLFAIAAIIAGGVPFVLWMNIPGPLMTAAAIVVVLLLAGVALFLRLDAAERPLAQLLQRLAPAKVGALVLRGVAGAAWTARNSREMLQSWPRGAVVLLISIGCQLLIGFVVFLLLRSMGQSIALGPVLFLFPFVQLLSLVPVSFAGWGLREGAMVVAFRLVGVPADAALSASILFGLCLLISSLPGAVLWLAYRRQLATP
jgi:uncharacterized protein (TIRG00374 family)